MDDKVDQVVQFVVYVTIKSEITLTLYWEQRGHYDFFLHVSSGVG